VNLPQTNSSITSDFSKPGHFFSGDRIFTGLTSSAAYLVLFTLLAILIVLGIKAWPAFSAFGLPFLWSSSWNPVTEQFGALSSIGGTVATSVIAMLIAVPISFGIAVFINELAPDWLKRPIGTAIELLAAIPSIIYGMWGLFIFAPFFADHIQPAVTRILGALPLVGGLFQGPPLGISVFNAGIVLAVMVIPFITAIVRDVFATVPKELKESAYAMGCNTTEVVWRVVLPYSRTGAIGGILLGLGRALGETMAVTFVIGNAHRLNLGLFMPGNTISSTLANEFTEADSGVYSSSLIALGLILFLITFFVVAIARIALVRSSRH